VTDYAQDQLADIVYVEYRVSQGNNIKKGESFGSVESVKAASDVYSPVSGHVIATNDLLEDTPEEVNTDPYGKAWMLKVEMADPSELDVLMNAVEYETHLETKEH
jgi:glycine cleavage system H protein